MDGVTAMQNPHELDWFLDIIKRENVRSYLEIGSLWGGSLIRVAEVLPTGSKVVSIDIGADAATLSSLQRCIDRIRGMGHSAELLVGDSAHRKIVKSARALGPYDLCLIDGDHRLAHVREDWDNYSAMSSRVAFHDIGWKHKPGKGQIDVPEFWAQIKNDFRHEQITLNERSNGIGIVWLEEDACIQAAPYSSTSRERRAAMAKALRKIEEERIEGDIVEAGVYKGGNIILARKLCPDRICWLYDTFTGMTEPGPEDLSSAGTPAIDRYQDRKASGMPWCEASVGQVRANLRETGTLDQEKLRFVVGDVVKTLRNPDNIPEKIALLRLDTDWYASTKAELEALYPRLVPGGVLIVDDYGHWQGARKAFDEYFNGKVTFDQIDYTAIMMVKPC